jgi:uncharacterized protein (TIGR00369 family)
MADMEVTSDLDRAMREAMPFTAILGMRAISASPAEVKARVDWDAALCTVGGNLHGGLLMALADTCGGWCAYLNLPAGSIGTATVESKTNFLRAVAGGYVEATARPLHVGRTFIVADTELRDHLGRLVARVTQTQAVIPAADTGRPPRSEET